MDFFWNKASGLNADITRHRDKEKELMWKITDLENKSDPLSIASLRIYRRFLAQLQQSKAAVVNKLGKKK